MAAASVSWGQVKTWTTVSDFNEGTYFNTNSTAVPGELRLNRFGTAPLPFLNIPVGGRLVADRGWPYVPGRIVRVNTESGLVVGEYRTTPAQFESAPSRGVVDKAGNVWVTNRYEGSGTYAVTKIGVIVGGERFFRPAPGVYLPHPLGEYVKDPIYTTGVDRDGDGFIRTSAGLGNLLPWNGTAGKDLDSSVADAAPGTVKEADDELITVFKRYRGSGGKSRSIAIDDNENIWLGFHDGQTGVLKLDNADGRVLQTILTPLVGYTMLYQDGYLWGTAIDTLDNRPWRIKVSDWSYSVITGNRATQFACFAPLASGDVVASTGAGSGHSPTEMMIVDKQTAAIKQYISVPGGGDLRGVIQDQEGTIWVASRGLWAGGPYAVYRYRTDGTLISTFYTGDRPCGLGLDSNGNVWVTHIGDPGNQGNGAWTTVIDPRANDGRGAIIGYVGLGMGSYNYSDGTGATTSQISRDGEWRVVYDSFRPNLPWGRVDWDATIPAGTGLEVFIRAANERLLLNSQAFVKLSNGQDVDGAISGRYVELSVRLSRDQGSDPSLTPSVRSLTLRYANGTVTGQVGLNNWTSLAHPDGEFRLVPVGGGNETLIPGIKLGPFGAFAFRTDLRGQYRVGAKCDRWLRQDLLAPVNILETGAHGLAFALTNGDVDGDNAVTLFDYNLLSEAFDTSAGDPGWYALADLDGDGGVTLFDYNILSANFDLVGD